MRQSEREAQRRYDHSETEETFDESKSIHRGPCGRGAVLRKHQSIVGWQRPRWARFEVDDARRKRNHGSGQHGFPDHSCTPQPDSLDAINTGKRTGRSTTGDASADLRARNFPPHDCRARDHGPHFSEGNRTRQIFEAAVRRDDNSLGRHMRQRAADARGDRLRCLDAHV